MAAAPKSYPGPRKSLVAHTSGTSQAYALALSRRVQWSCRVELELDDPALQGLAAEPVVYLTIGDASSSLLLEISSRRQTGVLGPVSMS